MNTVEKMKILGEAGRYDSCGPKSCEVRVQEGLGGILHKDGREEAEYAKRVQEIPLERDYRK